MTPIDYEKMTEKVNSKELNKSSKVILIRAEEYIVDNLYKKIGDAIDKLGGIHLFGKTGEKILIKPNMLAPDEPERATATHPVLVEAVARILNDSGAIVSCGDSPSLYDPVKTMKKTGIYEACNKTGVKIADFRNSEKIISEKAVQNKVFSIAKGVLDSDGIISLPKLKTHGLTLLTGAIKNQFGCIPGPTKAGFHAKLETVDKFSQMLVDLTTIVNPRLYIMDGILAMEGNGPRRGNPIKASVILVSDDPVAMDTVAAKLMCVSPEFVTPIVKGNESQLGNMNNIQIIGDPIEELAKKFMLPRFKGTFNRIPRPIRNLVKNALIAKPVIDKNLCTKCYECIRVCPTKPKSIKLTDENYPKHDYSTCIRCYCCQEVCPEGAISLKIKIFSL